MTPAQRLQFAGAQVRQETIELGVDLHVSNTCVFCGVAPALADSPSGLCLGCSADVQKDRAEEDEQRRQAAWFAHLKRLPEVRGNLFRDEEER